MSEIGGSENERLWNSISRSTKDQVIEIQSRSMSDPPISDIDFKYKMILVWTILEGFNEIFI